jgi:hypothetical protein
MALNPMNALMKMMGFNEADVVRFLVPRVFLRHTRSSVQRFLPPLPPHHRVGTACSRPS